MELKTGVEVWMGLPGAGKSTMGAVLAHKHLKKGYTVYSNFPISGCRKFDPQKDIMSYEIEHALILIDEAGLEYDNRDWQAFSKKSLEFFKTHRHYHLRVVLFSQFWDDVDKKIRTLTNAIYLVKPSIFPLMVHARRIKADIGISEEKQIVMQYDWAFFGRRWYYVGYARRMFDSWSHPPLKQKKWAIYDFPLKDSFYSIFLRDIKKSRVISEATRVLRKIRR